jgi:hypothetical protein
VTWEVLPAPPAADICFGAGDYLYTQAAGEKECRRRHGKILWLPPGVWTITACAPPRVDGVCAGSWTIEDFVVVD